MPKQYINILLILLQFSTKLQYIFLILCSPKTHTQNAVMHLILNCGRNFKVEPQNLAGKIKQNKQRIHSDLFFLPFRLNCSSPWRKTLVIGNYTVQHCPLYTPRRLDLLQPNTHCKKYIKVEVKLLECRLYFCFSS